MLSPSQRFHNGVSLFGGSLCHVWSDEWVDTLRRMWADGASAAKIAKEIAPTLTRNAVLGKAHRLGLTRHKSYKKTYNFP